MPTKLHLEKNKARIIFGGIGLVIILLAIGLFLQLYPVAIVGADLIPYREWSQDFAAAKKLDPNVTRSQVFDQFLVNKKKEQLAARLALGDEQFFQDEFTFYKSSNDSDYNKLINDYFSGDERQFETFVVEPENTDALLRIKYNSNYGLNNDAYNKAQSILDKLSAGQTFEDLAKQQSDDAVTAQFGGDIGFVGETQILPELKRAGTSSSLGQVNKNIIVSRLGYHILYPVETATNDNQKVWHLKQILIKTTGFDDWLKSQLDTIGAHQLMKI